MADGFTELCKPLHQDEAVIHSGAATISQAFLFLTTCSALRSAFQEVCVSLGQDLPDALLLIMLGAGFGQQDPRGWGAFSRPLPQPGHAVEETVPLLSWLAPLELRALVHLFLF